MVFRCYHLFADKTGTSYYSILILFMHWENKYSIYVPIYSFGDVPKWLKGPHSKCGRSGNPRRESSNLSISAKLSLDVHRVPSSAFSFALRSRLDWLSVLSQSYRLNQDIIRVPDTVFIKLASRAFREFYISTSDPAAAIHDTGLFTVFRQQPK